MSHSFGFLSEVHAVSTRLLALVVALLLAFGITGPKLYKMCQIRGWVPGAVTAVRTVMQKWHQTADEDPEDRDTYWIAITDQDVHKVGPHRLNVFAETWEALSVGDPVEIITVPGDPAPHLRDGIFASDSSFAFDLVLLTGELGVAGVMVWQVLQLARRKKKPA